MVFQIVIEEELVLMKAGNNTMLIRCPAFSSNTVDYEVSSCLVNVDAFQVCFVIPRRLYNRTTANARADGRQERGELNMRVYNRYYETSCLHAERPVYRRTMVTPAEPMSLLIKLLD